MEKPCWSQKLRVVLNWDWSWGHKGSEQTASRFFSHSHIFCSCLIIQQSLTGFVHCYSVARLCPTLCDPINYSTPGFPIPILHYLLSLLKLISIESMMPSKHLILCHPILLLLSIFPSIRVFCNKSALCIRWPKYWSFSISPSSEYSGLISFKVDCFDLLAVQGTLMSLPTPQCRSIKSSVLRLLYGPTLTSIHDYWKKP